MLLCDQIHFFAFEKLISLPSQRRVSLYCYIILSAEVDGWALPQTWMDFKLVNSGLDSKLLNQPLQMIFKEVAYPNILNFTLFLHLHKGSPSLMSHLAIFWIIWFQFSDSRPMNKDKIQILAS